MVAVGEQYVAAPPPAYTPPEQQASEGITPAAPVQTATSGTDHAAEKTAALQQDGNADPQAAAAAAAAPQQRMVVPLESLGDLPADVDCPYCKKVTRSKVVEEHSTMTYVVGGVIGLFCICLACLPCCMGAMQNVDHYCSECNGRLTHRPYDGQTQVVATPRDAAGRPNPAAVPSKY